ncbi:MAG: hypothetical protein NT099_07635 [Candidatus Saganbacteria bacterium]|nr:hypothetical protein [Candidatus Saganbacteria bacterium]
MYAGFKPHKPYFLLFLFAFISLILFVCGFSLPPVPFTDPIYKNIQAQATEQLSALFNNKVKIGSVSGTVVVGEIVLNNVEVEKKDPLTGKSFLKAEKFILHFNPLIYVMKGNNILPALYKITLVSAEAEVTRDKNGNWGIVSLLGKDKGSKELPKLPFKGTIIIQNSRANYTDVRGWGATQPQKPFAAEIKNLNGSILLKENDIAPSLKGDIIKNGKPTLVVAKGNYSLKKNLFTFKISADNLTFEEWGSYVLPIPNFKAIKGSASIPELIISGPTSTYPGFKVDSLISIKEGEVDLLGYALNKINGQVRLKEDEVSFINLGASYKNSNGILNGRIYDFRNGKMELGLEAQGFNLSYLKEFVPELKTWDISGNGLVKLKSYGTFAAPVLEAEIVSAKANLYGQEIKGALLVALKDNVVDLNLKKVYAYGGTILGKSRILLSSPSPQMEANLYVSDLNLETIAPGVPGISGNSNGTIVLSGPINNLKGNVSLKLDKALLFGQSVNQINSSFIYRNGSVILDNFSILSAKGSFTSSGTIDPDLTCNLLTQSKGLELKGSGFLGRMGALLKNFDGKIAFTLNEKFLKNPIKRLKAKGKFEIEKGYLGNQQIDSASGTIEIGNGQIHIEKGVAQTGNTSISIEGQTGLGIESNLNIVGKNCELENLQIFSHLIPSHIYSKIRGHADVILSMSGTIPKETIFTSFAPLLLLNTKIEILVKDASAGTVKFLPSHLLAEYKEKKLYLKEAHLETPTSKIDANGKIDADLNLDLAVKGYLDLANLSPILPEEESLKGLANFEAAITGNLANPIANTSFTIKDLGWNIFSLENIKGKVEWKNYLLTFMEPLSTQGSGSSLKALKNRYLLSGSVDFSKTEGLKNLEHVNLDLSLDIKDSDLRNFLSFIELIRAETQARLSISSNLPSSKIKINKKNLLLPSIKEYLANSSLLLYKTNSTKTYRYFLEAFEKETEELGTSQSKLKIHPVKNIDGILNGSIKVNGQASALFGKAELKVTDGKIQTYPFQELNCSASLSPNLFDIGEITLKKDAGTLNLKGTLTFKGEADLDLKVENLGVDILRVIFPEEDQLEGYLNLSASMEGSLNNPTIYADFNSGSLNLSGIRFDQSKGAFHINGQKLNFDNLNFYSGRNISEIKGTIPLSFEKGNFDLIVSLEGSSLGLINVVTNNINYDGGEALIHLSIKGPAAHPDIQGSVKLNNSMVSIPPLKAKIENINANLNIDNSIVNIEKFSSRWIGKNTMNEPNSINVTGNIDLNPAFSSQQEVMLNLNLKDTALLLELPGLYAGEIDIKNFSVSGPLPLSRAGLKKRGPLVKGILNLSEGSVYLPTGNTSKNEDLYLNYDLTLNLGKEINIGGGNATAIDLRNLTLNMGAVAENLQVLGNTEEPRMLGTVKFTEGSLSILSRDFTLLTFADQEKYYPYDRNKRSENTATFKGLAGEETIPSLNITALAKVTNYKEQSSPTAGSGTSTITYDKEEVSIVSHVTGMPFVKDETRGIKIAFEGFKEDATKKPTQITPAKYTEQEIKVLLLPDFLKGPLGLAKGEANPEEAGKIIDNYVNNYIRSAFVHKIERNLEKTLGLESLTLEYNFGRELRRSVTGTTARPSTSTSSSDTSKVGIGAVKGFFDRFYIGVKYAQLIGESSSQTQSQLFNYELICKLDKMWSVSYYQEPALLNNSTIGYSKITLNGGYSF